MVDEFNNDEKLYRAVYPPEINDLFWKKDGSLTSAAFRDKRGLSVERGFYREDEQVVRAMSNYFSGIVAVVTVRDCRDVNALVLYLPTGRSKYHSEIHGSKERIVLSSSQRKHLASMSKIIGTIPHA